MIQQIPLQVSFGGVGVGDGTEERKEDPAAISIHDSSSATSPLCGKC